MSGPAAGRQRAGSSVPCTTAPLSSSPTLPTGRAESRAGPVNAIQAGGHGASARLLQPVRSMCLWWECPVPCACRGVCSCSVEAHATKAGPKAVAPPGRARGEPPPLPSLGFAACMLLEVAHACSMMPAALMHTHCLCSAICSSDTRRSACTRMRMRRTERAAACKPKAGGACSTLTGVLVYGRPEHDGPLLRGVQLLLVPLLRAVPQCVARGCTAQHAARRGERTTGHGRNRPRSLPRQGETAWGLCTRAASAGRHPIAAEGWGPPRCCQPIAWVVPEHCLELLIRSERLCGWSSGWAPQHCLALCVGGVVQRACVCRAPDGTPFPWLPCISHARSKGSNHAQDIVPAHHPGLWGNHPP